MVLYRTNNFHLYGFTPRAHPRSRRQAIGLTVRVRARGRWRWLSVCAYWLRRDLRFARGTYGIEACSWLTENGERVRVKAFLRVKVGLGGRFPVPVRQESDEPRWLKLDPSTYRGGGVMGRRTA